MAKSDAHSLRPIDRSDIWKRRTEADNCLHLGLYHAATLTAGCGIELLLEMLAQELHEELSRSNSKAANKLCQNLDNTQGKYEKKTLYWGLGDWIRFYKQYSILDSLQRNLNYEFNELNKDTLKKTNDVWNECKHSSYTASETVSNLIVFFLNSYLEETNFQQDKDSQQQMTVGAVSRHWLQQWSQPLMQWLAQHEEEPIAEVLYAFLPFLDLILNLIDDKRINFQQKTPLLVSANYVFSDLDLIPETNIEVQGLVDDAAVLILTLYWLLQQENFDNSIVFTHWPGGEALSAEVARLKAYIWTQHDNFFPDDRRQMGSRLVWGVIKRIADVGPEALWQNYWKEQYRTEIN